MRFQVVSERGLMLYLGDSIDEKTSAQVQRATAIIEAELADAVIDLIPSYASLLILFNPLTFSHPDIVRRAKRALEKSASLTELSSTTVTLPVYYATETGPDLEALAANAGLSIEATIALHAASVYRVYAIGFAPGFAYLGEVDERLAAPRKATPRAKVPAGSVAIADRQTAVYPAASPGGWNLIGRCPVKMFDPAHAPSMPVAVGDQVRFEPISREAFLDLGGDLT
ncbi:MAG: 5-oxoprolinase subunit PxpB [Halioglobus sp.]